MCNCNLWMSSNLMCCCVPYLPFSFFSLHSFCVSSCFLPTYCCSQKEQRWPEPLVCPQQPLVLPVSLLSVWGLRLCLLCDHDQSGLHQPQTDSRCVRYCGAGWCKGEHTSWEVSGRQLATVSASMWQDGQFCKVNVEWTAVGTLPFLLSLTPHLTIPMSMWTLASHHLHHL